MKRKSPLLAAVLNFLLPGVGYLYVGTRVTFAVLLFIGFMLSIFGIIAGDTSTNNIELVAAFIASFAFAVDGWGEADRRNKGSFGDW